MALIVRDDDERGDDDDFKAVLFDIKLIIIVSSCMDAYCLHKLFELETS